MRSFFLFLACSISLNSSVYAYSNNTELPDNGSDGPAPRGTDPKDIYRADKVSDSLAKNANAVRRYESSVIEVVDADKAIVSFHEVVTILNSKSSHELSFSTYTDRFRTLEDVDIRLFDADGKQVERHTKKELTSTATGSGLVQDGFAHYITLAAGKFPVTIERKYTIRYNGLLQLPWIYVSEPGQSVERSIVTLKHPKTINVNYKWYNTRLTPNRTESERTVSISWELSNIPAGRFEQGSDSWIHHVPSIRFNLTKMAMDGFVGDFSSWNGMGLWYNKIAKDLNRLKPAYQQEVRALVSGVGDDREKVRILYKHLQDNFRYVSIQLGIGGFRPFPANFLHEKKYGDCKGLSNYLEACLDAVGIKSYSAWIRAGWSETWLDPEFPNDVFNHQILMVPLGKDSIWLECTSNEHDFNHLGSFTENRYALLLTENGGKLVKTPSGKAANNCWVGKTEVKIDQDGSATAETVLEVSGEFKYEMINLNLESHDVQRSFMITRYGFIHPDNMKILFGDRTKAPYQVVVDARAAKIFDFKAGSKLFIKPRLYKLWSEKLSIAEKRELDYLIKHPFSKSDTTIFLLPEGWTVESLPKNRSARFNLGKFESRYWYDEAKRIVFSTLTLEIDAQAIPATLYEEARKLFDLVLEDGNQKMVLRAD